uniref:V-type proton ATPase subunit C n=1 Tax=Lotharella globosa TaxID=91324 RepID=A0A7S4DKM6_9EUKA
MAKRYEPYWLVAFPQEYKGASRAGLTRLEDNVKHYAKVVKFDVPGNLKIGTLDSLMALTESLTKVDSMIQSALGKVSQTLEDLLQKQTELGVENMTISRYVETFQWSSLKYKTSSSLQMITNGIEADVKKYEADIRKLVNTHNEVSQTLEAIERTDNGNLLVRPLGPIIKMKEINPTPSLELIFIVVPLKKEQEFLATYETMEEQYKARRAKKEEEEQLLKLEQDRSDIGKGLPELLAHADDDAKRKEMMQGGAVYKHIAQLLRKAQNIVDAGAIFPERKKKAGAESPGPGAASMEAQAKQKLKTDIKTCRGLLAEAIEKKLTPYEHQAPNNSGAKRAVVDVVLTSDEFDIKSARVEACRKMVQAEYDEAKKKIDQHVREEKRALARKSKPDPPYVVPGSAKSLQEDEEYALYEIAILKRFKDEVLKICREKRLTVRAYKYDAQGEKKHHKKKAQLSAEKKKNFNHAQLKCRHLYPEIFIGWMHIKAVRCFAESILRFGLPKKAEDFKAIFPNHIQAALIQPFPGQEQRVRKVLQKLYSSLASEEVTAQLDASETDYSGFGADFYPYVYIPIDLNHA